MYMQNRHGEILGKGKLHLLNKDIKEKNLNINTINKIMQNGKKINFH